MEETIFLTRLFILFSNVLEKPRRSSSKKGTLFSVFLKENVLCTPQLFIKVHPLGHNRGHIWRL